MACDYQIAAYYFPNYHVDAANEQWHGNGWTEWEVLKKAVPRFEGHKQPKIPLWGYEDEANPAVMEKKIRAAADYGINAFIFDWYWHEEGPYLHRCLEEGFLGAENCETLKFAIMWANHDWLEIHPAGRKTPYPVRRRGPVSLEIFKQATDHMIRNYFIRENYWKVNGALYFSIYEMMSLVEGLGGLEKTKDALDDLRQRVRTACNQELHLNVVVWGIETLPTENTMKNAAEVISYLGIDSVTSYVWVHHIPFRGFPEDSYKRVRDICRKEHGRLAAEYDQPYFPNVTMGWDSSPRTIASEIYEDIGYPYAPVYQGNTPEEFEQALRDVRQYLDQSGLSEKIATLNAWNEWTEGSYLEPDEENGYAYLEAVRRVFQTSE